jgi:hypothetical protein
MHQITGYYFFTKSDKRFVVYSTLYQSGRYASFHDCTGLTEEQAKGKFIVDHNKEVDFLMQQKKKNDSKSKIILT